MHISGFMRVDTSRGREERKLALAGGEERSSQHKRKKEREREEKGKIAKD